MIRKIGRSIAGFKYWSPVLFGLAGFCTVLMFFAKLPDDFKLLVAAILFAVCAVCHKSVKR